MFVDDCTYKRGNKKYRRVLLRNTYREKGKIKHDTLGNLSPCSENEIEAIKIALRNKDNLVYLKRLINGEQTSGKYVGGVSVLYQVANRLGIVKALGSNQKAKIILWLVMSKMMGAHSKLSAVRMARDHAIAEIIGIRDFSEDDVYAALDWLYERKERVEKGLFRQKGEAPSIYLYDISSTYLEGQQNELAAYGYNRDKKKGKKQIVFGLLTDEEGDPISVDGYKGNTKDNQTLEDQIEKLKKRFGCKYVTLVGDKGMIKGMEIKRIKGAGFHYITTITKSQIRKMITDGKFQLSLFDEELIELYDYEEGLRYLLRRNPIRADEIRSNRAKKIERIKERVKKSNEYLIRHPRGKVKTQEKIIKEYIKKLRMENIVKIGVNSRERAIEVGLDEDRLKEVSELDGCYVIKTDLPEQVASKEVVHERYKDLSKVEWAFRTQKSGYLEVRPIFLRTEQHTVAHLVITMLAYKIERYLRRAWEEFDITVEEGLHKLNKITSTIIKVGKSKICSVAQPDRVQKKMIKVIKAEIPNFLPYRQIKVVTRKKLKKSGQL